MHVRLPTHSSFCQRRSNPFDFLPLFILITMPPSSAPNLALRHLSSEASVNKLLALQI